MGSNGAGRPSERPRQGSGKPLPRADSSKPSPATASQRSTHDRRQLFQHDQLRARLWAPRMSRFRGYRSIWSMCLTFALKGPRISTFRRRNPLELETPNLDWVFDGPDGVPSERTRNPRADRAPGRRFSFRANQQKPSSDLRPPLSGRSIPLLFFKARARQQNLEPRAIGPWRRPAVIFHESCWNQLPAELSS